VVASFRPLQAVCRFRYEATAYSSRPSPDAPRQSDRSCFGTVYGEAVGRSRGVRTDSEDSVPAGTEGTGGRFDVIRSSRWPERDLVRIHPHHAVPNHRRQLIEAARRRPERVVPQPVEPVTMRRFLEPLRRSTVHDPLAEVWASRQEGDRGSRWVGHHIGGQLGEQHDAFGTDLLHRPDTNPASARRVFGCGETNDGNPDESREDCDEGDKK